MTDSLLVKIHKLDETIAVGKEFISILIRSMDMQEAENEELKSLIRDLAYDDECDYDHHGYCQAHYWFYINPICPHARAQQIIKQTDQ